MSEMSFPITDPPLSVKSEKHPTVFRQIQFSKLSDKSESRKVGRKWSSNSVFGSIWIMDFSIFSQFGLGLFKIGLFQLVF
jgi:hypothetical protein